MTEVWPLATNHIPGDPGLTTDINQIATNVNALKEALPYGATGSVTDGAVATFVGDQTSQTAAALNGAYAPFPSVTQEVMRKLNHNEDVRIGILSDSTDDADTEWGYLIGQQLGAKYPGHTVQWHGADTASGGYLAPETIQTGTGTTPPVLHIYNRAIAGSNTTRWQGADLTATLAPGLHLVMISTGHNEGTFTGDPANLGQPRAQFTMRVQAVTETIRLLYPSTQIMLIAQHGWLDGTGDQDQKRDELLGLCVRRGYGFIDMYQAWKDAGTPSAWYIDNIHPNSLGEAFYATTIMTVFKTGKMWEPRPQVPSRLLDTRASVADDLVMPLGAAVPIGWTADNCTVTRDTTNYETPRGYSIGLARPANSAALSRIYRQVLNATEVKAYQGTWVTIMARVRRASAGASSSRYVGAVWASDGVNSTSSFTDDFSQGAFMWRVVPHFIAATATGLTISLYADATANGSMTDPTCSVDRLLVLPGLSFAGYGHPMGPRAIRNQQAFESVTVGDSTQTTVPALMLNAASGVTRAIQWLTGGVLRWQAQAQNAETGGNAGSDLLFLSRDDAGGFIGTALTLVRSTLAATFGSWIKTALYATASRPNAQTAGDGAQAYDSTLHRPIWSDATSTSAWNVGLVGIVATATLDFPSIAAGAQASLTMTVTGAAVGNSVAMGAPSSIAAGLSWSAYVSAANTVTVRVTNNTTGAIDPASATWTATVIR